ncbi:MAG: hypothetical protein QGH20_04905 [Candidatus Latescibacteria bacterium]|jgi:hypothetical protein|nr:hypothetical protein [Candidatus Latescibacterota bacterium]
MADAEKMMDKLERDGFVLVEGVLTKQEATNLETRLDNAREQEWHMDF